MDLVRKRHPGETGVLKLRTLFRTPEIPRSKGCRHGKHCKETTRFGGEGFDIRRLGAPCPGSNI